LTPPRLLRFTLSSSLLPISTTSCAMHAGAGFAAQPRGGARPGSYLAGSAPPGEMRGLQVVCSVADVRLKDLQGCVEHRMVLAANASTVRRREGGGGMSGSP
jgi:hypothetical protein